MTNGFVPDEYIRSCIQLWQEKKIQGMIFDASEAKFTLENRVKYPWILIQKSDQEDDAPSIIENDKLDFACAHFDELPTEMIQFILQYIDVDGLLTLARTCKFWKFHVRDSSVMHDLIAREGISSIVMESKPYTMPLVASSLSQIIPKLAHLSKGLMESGPNPNLVFSSISIREMFALLQPDRPAYLVYRYNNTNFFILWIPDVCKVKQKMIAASWAQVVVREFDCTEKIQMTDMTEMQECLQIVLHGRDYDQNAN